MLFVCNMHVSVCMCVFVIAETISGKIHKSYLQWLPLRRTIKETQSFYISLHILYYLFLWLFFFKEMDNKCLYHKHRKYHTYAEVRLLPRTSSSKSTTRTKTYSELFCRAHCLKSPMTSRRVNSEAEQRKAIPSKRKSKK